MVQQYHSSEKEEEGKKKVRGGLGCRGWGLSKGKVWAVGRANAQDPQGWKRPWGLWGVGLRLKEQKGPSCAPDPGLRGQGTSPGSPAGFLGLSGWGKLPPLLSCSLGPRGPLPPASPDLPWPPSYAPGTNVAGGRGDLGGQGTGLGAQQVPQARVGGANALLFPQGPMRPGAQLFLEHYNHILHSNLLQLTKSPHIVPKLDFNNLTSQLNCMRDTIQFPFLIQSLDYPRIQCKQKSREK